MITTVATHFATTHGAAIAAQLGEDPAGWSVDTSGFRAGFGVDPDETTSMTYAELKQRRELISRRLGGRLAE
ncbi:MAG: hypothetical protein ACK5RL_21095 [Acidimicrobiales bacterium]